MKKVTRYLLFCGFIFILFSCNSKSGKVKVKLNELEQECINVVDSVIMAVNERDMERFLDLLTDSVKFYVYRNEFYGTGKEKMREIFYSTIVQTPQINSQVANRIVLNNKVIDRQVVHTFAADQALHTICIYIVENGKVNEFNYFYY